MLNVLYVTSFFTHWSFFTYCSCIRKYCCNLVSLHLAESPLCQRSWHTKSIWGSFILGIWETHICSYSGMPWESDCLLLNWLVSFNSSLLNHIYNLYSEFLNSVNYFFNDFYLQTKLVDLSLLSAAEIDWLNNYHSQVWEKVSKSRWRL